MPELALKRRRKGQEVVAKNASVQLFSYCFVLNCTATLYLKHRNRGKHSCEAKRNRQTLIWLFG